MIIRNERITRDCSRHNVRKIFVPKKSGRLAVSLVEISTVVYRGGGRGMKTGRPPAEIIVSPTSGRRSAPSGDSRYPKLLITLHPRRARYRAWVSHYHVNIVVYSLRGKRARLRGYGSLDILFYGR